LQGNLFEAKLLALACSEAPEGRERWTMRLLAEEIVELKVVPSVSPMTVCNTLKIGNFVDFMICFFDNGVLATKALILCRAMLFRGRFWLPLSTTENDQGSNCSSRSKIAGKRAWILDAQDIFSPFP